MTILRLKDKSSHVRKKAIELLIAFMDTSPFMAIPQDMGSLSQKRFESHVESLIQVLRVCHALIQEKIPTEFRSEPLVGESEPMADNTEQEVGTRAPDVELIRIRALLKYYQDGAAFAKLINSSCAAVADLLGSSLKLEVASAMKFFVTAQRFDLEGAEVFFG
jgi:hypothetical protein